MITEQVLSNGIQVVIEQQEYFRSVSFGVWVRTGSAYETMENQGISHLIEHMLFKGTTTRSAKDIANTIARVGDDINAYTCKEYTCFYGSTLPEFLTELAGLFADMLTNSTFDETELTKEKSVVMDEIDMYNDSPEDLVHEKLQEAVWGPHPLSFLISGEKTSVERITRDELLRFTRTFYTGRNMIISLAGNPKLDAKELIALLEQLFGGIVSGVTQQHHLTPASYQPTSLRIHKKIEQLHLNLAFEAITTQSEERYVASVFNAAFGGSDNSLLFQQIREEHGLAYSVYSYLNTYLCSGLFHIDVTVNPKQVVRVTELIRDIIRHVQNVPFEEEELNIYKNQIKIDYIMRTESAKARMSKNAKDLFLYGSVKEMEDAVSAIMEITPFQIMKFAKKYLNIEKASLCLVGKISQKEADIIERLLEDNTYNT